MSLTTDAKVAAQEINFVSYLFTKETEIFYFQGHIFCILAGTLPCSLGPSHTLWALTFLPALPHTLCSDRGQSPVYIIPYLLSLVPPGTKSEGRLGIANPDHLESGFGPRCPNWQLGIFRAEGDYRNHVVSQRGPEPVVEWLSWDLGPCASSLHPHPPPHA